MYRSLVNVREKKIELVKIEGNYYLKLWVRRDSSQKGTTINFLFS